MCFYSPLRPPYARALEIPRSFAAVLTYERNYLGYSDREYSNIENGLNGLTRASLRTRHAGSIPILRMLVFLRQYELFPGAN
jgi:hypothetical protein